MMSLNALKETLKPCNNSLPSSKSSNSSILDIINTRKPPKSSLYKQLLRLEETRNEDETCNNHKQEAVEEDQQPKRIRPKLDTHPIGPYDPLLLSQNPIVHVPASINCRLMMHQREGVKFLYNLYRNNHGGVLGDDMGLGKTIQTIAFLAAVFGKDGDLGSTELEKKGPVLIVGPSSVIQNWLDEFSKWSTFDVSIYHGPNRDMIFRKLEANGVEVLITSFDTYRIHGSILSQIQWEIVIVDEAHRLKNEKSKLYSACLEIKTLKRYGLTGTIMQNKIMELFNVFDWAAPGCLGNREHFREYYDEPLKHGQRATAPETFVRIADERKQHLVAVLGKYLLRRTKEETIGHLMMGKEDNVVFCAMSDVQKRVYQRMLQLPDVQCLVNKDLPCSCGSPLKQVECCKRTVPDGVMWPYFHKDNPEGCDSCPYCLVLPCLVKLQQVQVFAVAKKLINC
ncbi:damaged DNA-binding protein [Lithospermum erythrorhizon]|uniref:Damaged DNA-binding protein n=1 Tax=Lithospermum erythrorhizon TaxID=34254 RepID=A0AAV3P8J2_LITER